MNIIKYVGTYRIIIPVAQQNNNQISSNYNNMSHIMLQTLRFESACQCCSRNEKQIVLLEKNGV